MANNSHLDSSLLKLTASVHLLAAAAARLSDGALYVPAAGFGAQSTLLEHRPGARTTWLLTTGGKQQYALRNQMTLFLRRTARVAARIKFQSLNLSSCQKDSVSCHDLKKMALI